ncbi:hypothetical protein P168DRAFT_298599 [Aspergillus campestris IBT 28561]|uniref:DUF7598 domain-containing protein n=1 Tax=Aspergillus campestris (strain IBT 28561) TaxID=1392248 RepID=A0A2I1CW87_ASPC2|nr:uncharacterized protein P168DRAFT_298599 [Aspergillus campestris IBT 28561]PKY01887.1 hypothetical protein P168DRAFT_298599 [Aspergillus campestris IBT 28561]
MGSLKESLAGPGFIILNAIRVLNIIALLDIIAASVVMLIKISMLSSFFFFEAVSHVIAAGISIFLIVSELPFFRGYFDRNWQLLSQDSGFITLALAMLMLGVGVLGDLNTEATSQESLGLAFWRIVLSAGILAMVMSVVNLASSFIFADRELGVSARHVRVYGAVAPQKVISRTSSQRSFQLSTKREETLPTYTSSPIRRQSTLSRFPVKISGPLNPNDAASIKSLLIFFAPVIIPRLLNFYRTARVLITQRPPPRPLPTKASQALNVLFFAIALFLALSLPWNPHAPESNIFALTRSRINTPTDVLFSRLTRHRAGNTLTAADELLRSKLISLGARKAYLRYGPDTLTGCQFCSLDNLHTHLLYYLPFNTLIPHLFHMAIIGLATSAPLAGRHAARWRNKFTLAGLALAAIDCYIVATYDPIQSGSAAVRAGMSTPTSLYDRITVLRPLAFAVFDAACAAVIYLTATNRFFFTPPSQADAVDQLVSQALSATGDARAKLHASSVTRNAVVRDKQLKERDDAYWRTVVAMSGGGVGEGDGEGVGNGEGQTVVPTSIWEEEEVVRAMSRAMSGHGGVDLAQLGVNAAEYVDGVTGGLDR